MLLSVLKQKACGCVCVVCVCVRECKLSLAAKVLGNLWHAMCVRSHVITSYTLSLWHSLIFSCLLKHTHYFPLCVCVLRVYLWLFSYILHDEIIIFSARLSTLDTGSHFDILFVSCGSYITYMLSTCNILNVRQNSHVELIPIIRLDICYSDYAKIRWPIRSSTFFWPKQ